MYLLTDAGHFKAHGFILQGSYWGMISDKALRRMVQEIDWLSI